MDKLFKILTVLLCCGYIATAQEVIYSSDSTKTSEPTKLIIAKRAVAAKMKPIKAPKPILHELAFGFRLNTDGWGIYSDYGKVKTQDLKHADIFHNLLYYQFEFSEKKDPKEVKINSTSTNRFGGSSSYRYGKINSLYVLKVGLGYQKMIAGKPDPGCVAIHWANTAGFALGMLKPYYLNVYGDPEAIKYSEATQGPFLDQNSIEGSAGFSKGLGEMAYVPGGYIRSALNFDFSTNKNTIIGVQVGANAEFYSQNMQLMANQPPKMAYYDMFIAVQFGRRW
jgi:hypothetical protein